MKPARASTDKRMRLRYAGVCRLCCRRLPAGQEAIYERGRRTVRCVQCPTGARTGSAEQAVSSMSAAADDSGVAGASARREYERRKTNRELRLRARHPRIGGLLARINLPHSTTVWDTGASGEEVLGARLDRHASDRVAVLHDRRVRGTRANIDHIVITTGGVYVIDAKRYADKRPARRVEGGILRRGVETLMVGGRDRTALVDGVLRQVERVRSALDDDGTEVTGVLCFVDADWSMFGAFFSIAGVQVVSPRRLGKILDREAGDVGVRAIRDRLALDCPSA